MNLTEDNQALIDFFAHHSLPSGFQHVNEYSVYLDLPGAVSTFLQRLQSDVVTNQKSAAMALIQIREWAIKQESNVFVESE